MGFALIGKVPETPHDWHDWSFSHMAHHRDMLTYIQQTYGVTLPEYILDPMEPGNREAMQSWFYQHQQMHDAQDSYIGVGGYDLNSTDFANPEMLKVWIFTNSGLHYLEAEQSGVW